MKVYLWIALLVCFADSATCASEKLTPAEEIIDKVMDSPQLTADGRYFTPPDLGLIPPELMGKVVDRLRAVGPGGTQIGTMNLGKSGADLLLLRLGDKVTIERMIGEYRVYDSRHAWDYVQTKFERAAQPKIIAYLAEDLDLKEDVAVGRSLNPPAGSMEFAVAVPPRSIFSAVTILRIVANSPAFSAEMKEWARESYELRRQDAASFRESMRVWWAKNKAAFEREDYQAVVPVKASAPLATPSPTMALEANPLSPIVPSTPTAFVDPVISKSTPPSTPTATVDQDFLKWPWVLGLVGLTIVIVAVMLKRGL